MRYLLESQWAIVSSVPRGRRAVRQGVQANLPCVLLEARVRGMLRPAAPVDGGAGMLQVRLSGSLVPHSCDGRAARVGLMPVPPIVIRLCVLLLDARRGFRKSIGNSEPPVRGRVVRSARGYLLAVRDAFLRERCSLWNMLEGCRRKVHHVQ